MKPQPKMRYAGAFAVLLALLAGAGTARAQAPAQNPVVAPSGSIVIE